MIDRRRTRDYARIVDEDVYRSLALCDLLGELCDRGAIGEVNLESAEVAACRLDALLGLAAPRLELRTRADDVRTSARERFGHRETDAASTASHERDLAAEVEQPRGIQQISLWTGHLSSQLDSR